MAHWVRWFTQCLPKKSDILPIAIIHFPMVFRIIFSPWPSIPLLGRQRACGFQLLLQTQLALLARSEPGLELRQTQGGLKEQPIWIWRFYGDYRICSGLFSGSEWLRGSNICFLFGENDGILYHGFLVGFGGFWWLIWLRYLGSLTWT